MNRDEWDDEVRRVLERELSLFFARSSFVRRPPLHHFLLVELLHRILELTNALLQIRTKSFVLLRGEFRDNKLFSHLLSNRRLHLVNLSLRFISDSLPLNLVSSQDCKVVGRSSSCE